MKKLCLTCGSIDETGAATCPADGEASWQPIEESPPAPPADDADPVKTKKKAAK